MFFFRMAPGIIRINTIVKSALICFDQKIQVKKENGRMVPLNELCVGDKILSINDERKFFDEVIKCSIIEGYFQAFEFAFQMANLPLSPDVSI